MGIPHTTSYTVALAAQGAPRAASTVQNQDICQNGGWSSTVVRDGVGRSERIVPDAYVPLVMHRTHRISIMYSGLPGKSTLCAGFMHLNHVPQRSPARHTLPREPWPTAREELLGARARGHRDGPDVRRPLRGVHPPPHVQAEDSNGRPGFAYPTNKRYTLRCGGGGRGAAAARGRRRVRARARGGHHRAAPGGRGEYVSLGWESLQVSWLSDCRWELKE